MFPEPRVTADLLAVREVTAPDRRPVVVHVCDGGSAIGGVSQHLWSLVPRLQEFGFHVKVVFLGGGATLRETEARGIPSRAVKKRGRGDLLAVLRLARVLRELRASVVHTHTLSTNFYGRFAAVLARVPVRITSVHSFMADLLQHDPAGGIGNRLLFWQNQLMNRFVHRIVAVSPGVRDWLLTARVPADRIRVIRCGIDLNTLGDALGAREFLGLERTDWVIGNIARADPVKDQMALLEAAIPMMLSDSPVKLAIIGEGPERERLQARVRSAGVGQQVVLPGRIPDARSLMPAFDVFALSSRVEGVPLALLEAMAAHRPVVATRVGGIPDVVENGESGLLVPPGSPGPLAEAIARVRARPELAERLGAAGRLRVEQMYDVNKTGGEMADLYRELLDEIPGVVGRSAGERE
jgi:glycosyltransferase involved in cell wall biosynthesis